MLSKKVKNSHIYVSAAGYLYLPIIVFVSGWTKAIIAIPVIALTAAAIFFSLKKICERDPDDACVYAWEPFLAFLCFFAFFVVAGHSDLFAQDFDWHKHHAVFNDLLNYDWPVVYHDGSMLTYYLGQYIVPAFVGKVFHSSFVMTWMIPVWNAIGLTLVYSVLTILLDFKSIWKKIVIILFMLSWGGCTSLGSIIYNYLESGVIKIIPDSFKWIDLANIRIHFASNYDALHDAFQHVIVPWVSTCFFIKNKEHLESYVMIALPLVFAAPFAFVYFVPILLFFAFWILSKNRFSDWLKSVFSLGNLLMIPVAVALLIYFVGNVFAEKPESVGFGIFNMKEHLSFYLIFVAAEFLLYSLFLLKRNKKNLLFYVATVELLLIPFFQMGMFNDLCSRGGIPARFILMYLCLDFFFVRTKIDWRVCGLALLLSFAIMINGFQFYLHMKKTYYGWNSPSILSDDYKTLEGFSGNPAIREDEAYNYFTPDYQKSLFYHISKK